MEVIAPPGELFSETNDNLVIILLSYGRSCILLAGDAEAREEYRRAAPTRALKWWSKFQTTKHSEPHFRLLLTEGASEVALALRLHVCILLMNYATVR
jgi:hypothetical protein